MDWTLSLKAQQADFLYRLNSDLSKHNVGLSLLHHPTPNCFSELTIIEGPELVNLQTNSQLFTHPDRELSVSYFWHELAKFVITQRFANWLESEQKQSQDQLPYLILSKNSQIKVAIVISSIKDASVHWLIKPEILENCIATLFVIIENFTPNVTPSSEKYGVILAGFLPNNFIQRQMPFTKINVSDLLYCGGLGGYLTEIVERYTEWEWMRSLTGRSNYTYPVAISADGQTLVSSGFEGTIKIWQISTGEHLQTLSESSWSSGASALRTEGQNITTAINDKMLNLSCVTDGKLSRTLPGHSSGMSAIAISSDGKIVASGGYDGSVMIWNLLTGQQINTWTAHEEAVKLLVISPNGKAIATSAEKVIKLWDLATGNLCQTFHLTVGTVLAIAISNDHQTIACGGKHGMINIWDIATGRLKNTFSAHAGAVRSISISPDGQTIASSSMEKTIKLWQIENGDLLRTLTGYPDPIVSISNDQDTTISLNLFRHQQPGWSDLRQWE